MPSTEERASFWERLFRCTTRESAESELAGAAGIDLERRASRVARPPRDDRPRGGAPLGAGSRSGGASVARPRARRGANASRKSWIAPPRRSRSWRMPTRSRSPRLLPGCLGVDLHLARPFRPPTPRGWPKPSRAGSFTSRRARPRPSASRRSTASQVPRAGACRRGHRHGARGAASAARSSASRSSRARAPSERVLRIVFGAANHLSVHLDRVLAVAEAEQGRFRAILDSMPHAVVLTDASFRLVHANASAERLLPRLGGRGGVGREKRGRSRSGRSRLRRSGRAAGRRRRRRRGFRTAGSWRLRSPPGATHPDAPTASSWSCWTSAPRAA